MVKKNLLANPYFFLVLALLLFFPVFLVNIEDQPISEDESIRALVAFEMHKSSDYITPTIGGEPYFKKPPLYNWLIAASYTMFGDYSETSLRFPMILSLLFFSLTIFYFVKKELGLKMGVINALIFMTIGRILFFETLHGLIDITYSWLTYLFFMTSYVFFRKKKYLLLFVSAYFITSITYLMKGLPSLVFLGITLLVLFISNKQFKMLFNWRHFVGIFILIFIVGGYYLLYFNANDISPKELLWILLDQTTRRTVIRFGWLTTLTGIFTFPFAMFYHFLPWTVLILLLFTRGSYKKIKSHPFLKYNVLILVFNIIVYWTSPEVHARYIIMLLPLFFTVLTWLYFDRKEKNHKLVTVVEYILGILLIAACIAPFGALFHEVTKVFPHILFTAIWVSAALVLITIFFWKQKHMRLFWTAIALLVIRLGFDVIVLPTRQLNTPEIPAENLAIEIAEQTAGKPLVSYWNPEFEPFYYYRKSFLLFRYHFYLSRARDEIVSISSEKKPDVIYFAFEEHIKDEPVNVIGSVVQNIEKTKPCVLFTFDFEDPPLSKDN